MKRALFLIVLLLMACFSARADGSADFVWETTQEGAVITGYTGAGGNVVVPELLGGLPVVEIGSDAFTYNLAVTSISFPETVQRIGSYAFLECRNLMWLSLPEGLVSIDEWAFAACTSLVYVEIPESVAFIGMGAFYQCSGLKNIIINTTDVYIAADAFTTGNDVRVLDPSGSSAQPTPEPAPEATPEPTPEPTPVPGVPINAYSGQLTYTSSSSYLQENYDVTAKSAFDGDLDTAWNSNQKAVGEWICASVPKGETATLAGFRIANGYWKSDLVYEWNSCVRTLKVYCDEVCVGEFSLRKSRTYQLFWLDTPATGNSFRFEITDAYYGSHYKDTCITELDLLGAYTDEFTLESLSLRGKAVDLLAERLTSGGRLYRDLRGADVAGLQILLSEGFGLTVEAVDGTFGAATQTALQQSMERMLASSVADQMEHMSAGVANAAYWNNLLLYLESAG